MEAFPSRLTWCHKKTNTRLKSGSFVHSTVSLCLGTNCRSCRLNRSRHFRMLSSWCPYKLFVFAVIMASAPVGFPVPQVQEGLDEREALDSIILDYIQIICSKKLFAWKTLQFNRYCVNNQHRSLDHVCGLCVQQGSTTN